jgi:outer membrane receptor for ferrienterochelin and colicin
MRFRDDAANSSYINLKQKLNISLFPVKKIQVSAGAEHYHTKFNHNISDNLLLLNAGARWAVSNKIDLSLSATNLMNGNYYRYSRHATLSETVYSHLIRPRNIMVSVQVKF